LGKEEARAHPSCVKKGKSPVDLSSQGSEKKGRAGEGRAISHTFWEGHAQLCSTGWREKKKNQGSRKGKGGGKFYPDAVVTVRLDFEVGEGEGGPLEREVRRGFIVRVRGGGKKEKSPTVGKNVGLLRGKNKKRERRRKDVLRLWGSSLCGNDRRGAMAGNEKTGILREFTHVK